MNSPADLIVTHARVLTQNLAQPRAEAVAVRGNRIVFVGSNTEAAHWRGPATRVVDGQQCTLLPGFIDSHFHLYWGCQWLGPAQLGHASTTQAVLDVLREYAAQHLDEAWVEGRGLRYNLITGRKELDLVSPNRPAYVVAYDGHTTWANTKALELAGILYSGEPIGPNSEIVRDEHGVATGELREAGASQLVRRLVPDASAERKRALLHKGLKLIAQSGVTSVHNMNGNMEELSVYAALEDAGELSLRVYEPFHVEPHTPFEALAEAAEMAKVQGDSSAGSELGLARGGAAKFFMDGVLESWTALMVEPYVDKPDSHGDSLFSHEHFVHMAAECDRLGLQIFVHCCGDGAVRRTLDGYEAIQKLNGRRDSRHRVEHIEVIHPDDLPRFQQLGVLGSVQPLHSPLNVNDGDVWPTRAGKQNWHRSFAWRTLKNAGVHLAFGSDWPVVTFDPMWGVYAALNRTPWQAGDPDQHLTLEETLAGYTRDAAYAEFMENEKGQLAPGFLADMVLLNADLEQTPKEAIGDLDTMTTKVNPVLTMTDGRIVFEG